MYQNNEFVVEELNQLKVERLVVCERTKTKETVLVYLKVETEDWYQYYLDAGIGFWDKCTDLDFEEDEEFKYVDLTQTYDLVGKVIIKAFCMPESHNSRIVIEFPNNGQLVLKCTNPEIFDSESKLIRLF